MPKLARQYDDRYYSSYRAVSNTSRTSSYGYSKEVYLDAIYGPSKIEKPQPKLVRRRKPKAKKKRSLLQCLVVLGVLGFVLINALSYSFNNITKAMFVPTPYQEIQTDMYDLSFPTYNYLSNTWAFGHRGFNFSADEKNAQMSPL